MATHNGGVIRFDGVAGADFMRESNVKFTYAPPSPEPQYWPYMWWAPQAKQPLQAKTNQHLYLQDANGRVVGAEVDYGVRVPPPNGETRLTLRTASWRGDSLPVIQADKGFANGSRNWRGTGGRLNSPGRDTGPYDGYGFGFDYWERVLLDPTFLDLGNVVSDLVFSILLRSTYRRDTRTLTLINNNAGDGITVTGINVPSTFKPLMSRFATLTIGTAGPPNIDGTVDFVFDTGTSVLTITGTRIIIFPYPPEGDEGTKEQLVWLTDVLRTANGNEQRISLREWPRQSVEYNAFIKTRKEMAQIQNFFMDWATRVFGVPLWWDARGIAVNATAGDSTILVGVDPDTGIGGTSYADFRQDGLAMLIEVNDDGTRTLEVLQIAAVPASPENTITFTTPISNSYRAGYAAVVPVVAGIMDGGKAKSVTWQGGNFQSIQVKFELLDNVSTATPDASPWPSMNDADGNPLPVITDLNFAGETLSEDFMQQVQKVDFATGDFYQLTQERKARRSSSMTWESESTQTSWEIRRLLMRLRGQQGNFWLPTWREDFVPTQNLALGGGSIQVENVGYNRYVNLRGGFTGLRIRLKNGSVSYHRIIGGEETDATVERLDITPVLPFTALIEDVEQIDMLVLSRMATDRVAIVHRWSGDGGDKTDEQFRITTITDDHTV